MAAVKNNNMAVCGCRNCLVLLFLMLRCGQVGCQENADESSGTGLRLVHVIGIVVGVIAAVGGLIYLINCYYTVCCKSSSGGAKYSNPGQVNSRPSPTYTTPYPPEPGIQPPTAGTQPYPTSPTDQSIQQPKCDALSDPDAPPSYDTVMAGVHGSLHYSPIPNTDNGQREAATAPVLE